MQNHACILYTLSCFYSLAFACILHVHLPMAKISTRVINVGLIIYVPAKNMILLFCSTTNSTKTSSSTLYILAKQECLPTSSEFLAQYDTEFIYSIATEA